MSDKVKITIKAADPKPERNWQPTVGEPFLTQQNSFYTRLPDATSSRLAAGQPDEKEILFYAFSYRLGDVMQFYSKEKLFPVVRVEITVYKEQQT